MSYLNNSTGGWGYQNSNQQAANKVDHIADKMAFAIDMLNNQIIGIDEIEKELRAIASGAVPPRPEQLVAIAGRLDTYQNQIKDGFNKIKLLTQDIDTATDAIQTRQSW